MNLIYVLKETKIHVLGIQIPGESFFLCTFPDNQISKYLCTSVPASKLETLKQILVTVLLRIPILHIQVPWGCLFSCTFQGNLVSKYWCTSVPTCK